MKLVILNRDGTLNALSEEIIRAPADWVPLPGALEAVARLNHAGFHVVIAMNQSGLGRGLFDMATFNTVHAHMHRRLAAVGGRIDAVFYCPHSPDEGCSCRKPLPGLFRSIAEHFRLPDLKDVPVVGDSHRDLHAGLVLGAGPIGLLFVRLLALAGLAGIKDFRTRAASEALSAPTLIRINLISRGIPLLAVTRPPFAQSQRTVDRRARYRRTSPTSTRSRTSLASSPN